MGKEAAKNGANAKNQPERRVLVVEDEALIRLDIAETLNEAGFDVVGEAADGEEAVNLALDLEPERARDAGTMAFLVKPFEPKDLLPAVEVALSRHQEMLALEDSIADLQDRFDTRKQVDRAKGLLMDKMDLTEPEAFRWIQKTSMDRRLSMREVADAVIEQLSD